MDNPVFQNDDGVTTRHPKKVLARANSMLMPTTRSWHLTQAARPTLCRCNSVLVPSHRCAPATDYPFASKPPTKNILSDNSLWTKEFWSESYSRLHDPPSPAFHKFPPTKCGVSTIYDPQFLSSYRGAPQDKEVRKWWRTDAAVWRKLAAALCILALTLLASANILYTVKNPLTEPNKEVWVDIVLISGEFKILNEPYRLSLNNQSSNDFQQLSGLISRQLDSLFSLSVISEPYHSTVVTQLLPGLLVRCQVVLRAGRRLTASRVGLAFIGGLHNQHGHVWLGNFTVDIQSIGFQASGDAVSWMSWSEWGECRHTREWGYVQLRSRNCTLRSGQPLYSTLPCLLVPHSHGSVETEPCKLQPDADNFTDATSERTVADLKVTREDHREGSGPCGCIIGQVCVAVQEQEAPQCLPVLDTSDPTGCGGYCKINTQLCQKIQDNAFRCVEDSQCLEEEWQCGNKLCIPQSKRCDGHFNCYDHTDEHNCDCVGAEQFTCNDSQCIPNHRFCDGFPDCNDYSDEPFGCGGECKTHEWRCRNARCVPQIKRCDKTDDCGDASDEADCPTVVHD